MKLTAFFLLIGCLHVSAGVVGQTVTLKVKDAPMKEVFREIQKQTGFDVFVDEALLEKSGKVTLDVKDMPVPEVLNLCLKNEPLNYVISDGRIVIKLKSTAGFQPPTISETAPPPLDVHGRIVDEEGKPMLGVSVRVKGGNIGTKTDADGMFVLRGVDETATLEISYVGFETQTVPLGKRTNIVISLKRSDNPLDQVQIIAYGKTTERFSTGDVSTVSAADIEKQPVSNPLLALEGRVPGLFIAQSNGLPGSGITVQIQGQNSIFSGNAPLYVIDGVPYPSQLAAPVNSILGGGSLSGISGGGGNVSPFSFINPGDIESISVLKDADATAIYGSRAANGAILITTKRGKPGRTSINFNLQQGVGSDTRRMKLLNTAQYLSMRREAFRNDGLAVPSVITSPNDVNYDINGFWDTTRYTDWQNVLLGGSAQYTDLQGNVSGGTSNTQFFVGGAYHRETTVFPTKLGDQKGSMHINLQHSSDSKRFNLSWTGDYLSDQNRLPYSDLTGTALFLAPNAPVLYNPDGSLNWAPTASGNSSWTNPLAIYNVSSIIKTNNLVSNMTIGYQLLPNLEIKADVGYNHLESNESDEHPSTANAPEKRTSNTVRYSFFQHNDVNTWNIEPQAVYHALVGGGKLEGVVGMQLLETTTFGQYMYVSGFTSDLLIGDVGSAGTFNSAKTLSPANYKYVGGFGRLNYNWQDRYILNLSARRDGSSRFGSANQFHNFWSVGGAWIFSQTALIKKKLPWLSFGKLSASYGTTGNDQIGDYQFLSVYTTPSGITTTYQATPGLLPQTLSNPYLQWEETRKRNAKLELGFFHDRIRVSADYFLNRSSNQLLPYTLSFLSGFNSITRNFPGTIQNSGGEFALNTINIRNKNFNWTTDFNLTIPRNKLVAFPNLTASSYASSFVIGKSISLIKAYQFLGTDPATGIFQVANANGDPTLTPAFADRTLAIIPGYRWYGGIQNNIGYKGWQLSFFIQFTKQTTSNAYGTFGTYPGVFSSTGPNGNQPTLVLNRWQHPGDHSVIQRYSTSLLKAANATSSDAIWSDASYARVKNINLSYCRFRIILTPLFRFKLTPSFRSKLTP
jgi:TonB-linked SusC/RagA family outer membrane protein